MEAIREADAILIGPGSLYTSIMPNLLVPRHGAKRSSLPNAVKMYICNVMTQPGETDGYTVSDHLRRDRGACRRAGCSTMSSSTTARFRREVLAQYAEEGALRSSSATERSCGGEAYTRHRGRLVRCRPICGMTPARLSHHIDRLVQDWISGKR